MSLIVTVATQVRDPDAVHAACLRLGHPEPALGTATPFEGQAAGLLVLLPGWLYPVPHPPSRPPRNPGASSARSTS
ncbi:hypothetical protein TA3x_002002 [Tundrisphaera sp. TA3]|uniref:hypothetical protein n=1 Tax=Tundrisphaera sp. TA3 TaxID=3435775 RepID=UPI003EBBFDB8